MDPKNFSMHGPQKIFFNAWTQKKFFSMHGPKKIFFNAWTPKIFFNAWTQKNFFNAWTQKKFFQCMDPKKNFFSMHGPQKIFFNAWTDYSTTRNGNRRANTLTDPPTHRRPITGTREPTETRANTPLDRPPGGKPLQAKKKKRPAQPNLQVLESTADPETIVANIFCTGLRLRRPGWSQPCGALPGFVHRAPPKILNMHRIS